MKQVSCPYCDSKGIVLETRTKEYGVTRRRHCTEHEQSWTTIEVDAWTYRKLVRLARVAGELHEATSDMAEFKVTERSLSQLDKEIAR